MGLERYQKVCLALIIALISYKYLPIIYGKVFPESRVKPGQVWRSTLYGLLVYDECGEYEITQVSLRKVIAVEGDDVIYIIQNDTTKYTEDIDDFTFNGRAMTNFIVQDINN